MIKIGQIRQGDVLLVPVDTTPPQNARSVKEAILAEGELTGHAHRITADKILVWDDMVWVVGPEPGALFHEDHDPIPAQVVAPQQAYQIVIQEEKTLSGKWRRVED